jgi:hypothetical protein
MAVAALTFIFPLAELAWLSMEVVRPVRREIGECLQDFAMLDVFALSVFVVANASGGVHDAVNVAVLPAGWFFAACMSIWLVFSLTCRTRSARMLLSKQYKLISGAAESRLTA